MLWIPFATRLDGPPQKQGYSFAPSPPGSSKVGFVFHSAEGFQVGMLSVLQNDPISSWHLSILYDGTLWQHYPFTANCWHAGDADGDGGVAANIDLVGIEFEGIAGEVLNSAQIATAVKVYQWAQQEYGFAAPVLHDTLHEHNWVSDVPTACPSGRIPWRAIIDGVSMTDLEARVVDIEKGQSWLIKKLEELMVAWQQGAYRT